MINFFKSFYKKEIPILMYHRLIEKEEEKGVHSIYYNVDLFEKQLQYLCSKKYETITFRDLEKLSPKEKKSKKYVILTFDDGYEDNYRLLFPILKKYNMKAVIYIVSHLEYNKWDVEETNEKKLFLMTKEQIVEMHKSGLVEFGGHTMHHVKLNRLSKEEQKEEIAGNKLYLEKLLQTKLCSFAYPFGILNEDSKEVVRELGYRYAVATDSGPFCIDEDCYEVRRIGIFPSVTMSKFKRRVKGNYNVKKVGY